MDHRSCLLDSYKLGLSLLNCSQLQHHRHHHKYFYRFHRNRLVDQMDNLYHHSIPDDILYMDYQDNLLDIHKHLGDLLHDYMLHLFHIENMLIDIWSLDMILGLHIHHLVHIHDDIHLLGNPCELKIRLAEKKLPKKITYCITFNARTCWNSIDNSTLCILTTRCWITWFSYKFYKIV